jgi:hypothetical protein
MRIYIYMANTRPGGTSHTQEYKPINNRIKWYYTFEESGGGHDKWVPVTTAWRVLRLQMGERPPDMEGSCEYIE